MANKISCPVCQKTKRVVPLRQGEFYEEPRELRRAINFILEFRPERQLEWYEKGMSFKGIVTCHEDNKHHRWPIEITNDEITYRQEGVLSKELGRLSENTEDGIKQDIEEAAECQVAGEFKSAVVMCRRAIQLALEPRVSGAKGRTLGLILDLEEKMATHILNGSDTVTGTGGQGFR